MAWTATLGKRILVDGDAVLVVTYTDGIARFDETYKIRGMKGSEWLRDVVRDRIAELISTETWVNTLTSGEILPADNPIVPPSPTAAEIARETWIRKYRNLQAWMRAVNVGIESSTDTLFITLRDDVIATRLAGYKQFY